MEPPTEQTLAIILSGIPKDYTCKDIIINHLSGIKKKNANKEISEKSLERWRRIIRIITIDSSIQEAKVIFSSIFYFCKYARNASRNAHGDISVSIHPKWFETINRPSSIDLICSNIKLFQIPSSNISYSFIVNDTFYIATKHKLRNGIDQELLIQIPSSNISNINLCEYGNNGSEITFRLNSQCLIFEYYHRSKLWKCNHCNSINTVVVSDDEDKIFCSCCQRECDPNNPYYLRQINESMTRCNVSSNLLNNSYFLFVSQRRFYRKLCAFDTDIGYNDTFNVLSPLFNILDSDETKQSISSSIMFSNVIKLCFDGHCIEERIEYFEQNMIKMDTNIMGQSVDYKILNRTKCKESLLGIFVWLSDKYNLLIFPLLFRIFDFVNCVAFEYEKLEKYVAKIEELIDCGSMQWLLAEVIMKMNNLNITELEKNVDALEEMYEDKGIIDIDDENAKKFVYNLEISPFRIEVKECKECELESNEEWKSLDTVSSENYVISFAMDDVVKEMYATFKNVKYRMMYFEDYTLIQVRKPNSLMHHLWNNDFFEFYAATICNRPMDDAVLKEEHRRIRRDGNENNPFDDDGDTYKDGAKFVIDTTNVYQPPSKKQKISNQIAKAVHNEKVSEKQTKSIQKPKVSEEKDGSLSKETNSKKQTESVENPKESEESDEKTENSPKEIEQTAQKNDDKENKAAPSEVQLVGVAADMIADCVQNDNEIVEPLSESPNHQNGDKILGRKRRHEEMSEDLPAAICLTAQQPNEDGKQFTAPLSKEENQEIEESVDKMVVDDDPQCTFEDESESEIEEEEKSVDVDYSKISALTISNHVGTAYGVPIFSKEYFECADFEFDENDKDMMFDFGKLVIGFACKSDLERVKNLRRTRNNENRTRTMTFPDKAPCQFLKACFDINYRTLFSECFTKKKKEKMKIDLLEIYKSYASKEKIGQRGRRKFVIFEHGYGIKKALKERLYLLLRLFFKYATWCVVDMENRWPPWVQNEEAIISDFKSLCVKGTKAIAIDLSMESDGETDVDIDVWMKETQKSYDSNQEHTVKMECDHD